MNAAVSRRRDERSNTLATLAEAEPEPEAGARPLPSGVAKEYELCKNFAAGECLRAACTFAHGHTELAAWTATRESMVSCSPLPPHMHLNSARGVTILKRSVHRLQAWRTQLSSNRTQPIAPSVRTRDSLC